MNRCTRCILPENYCNITFDEKGVCNHCNDESTNEKIKYLGNDILLKEIRSFQDSTKNKNNGYDCIVPLSGGRDSTYLLYYFSKVLKLKCLALTIDNGFMPELVWENIYKTTEKLNVKLVVTKNPNVQKLFKHHIKSWMHYPSPATVGFLCVGCFSPLVTEIFKVVKQYKIPIVIWGETPFEHGSYKYDLLRLKPGNKSHMSYILGYLFQIYKNPRLFLKPSGTIMQLKEYINSYYIKKRTSENKKRVLFLSPFLKYIKWEEKLINDALYNKLGWKKPDDVESNWRNDCYIAMLKLYLYRRLIGYNDKECGLSALVRDKQLSRDEALKRIEKEKYIPENIIEELLNNYNLSLENLNETIIKSKT